MSQSENDEIRDLVRHADPAASLPPADPTWVARLQEDAMTDQHTDESRADGTHDRSRLTWIVAAAATLVIAGGLLLVTTRGDDDAAPTADDAPNSIATSSGSEPPTERTVTTLNAGAAGLVDTKCLTPAAAPEVVAQQDTVIDATVESISGSIVTLAPTRFYAGQPTDVVVVNAPGPSMEALLSAVSFEEGKRYLVSATDGAVTLCGFSGAYSKDLAAIYASAFPQ